MSTNVIQLLESFPLPICEEWMYEGIRHLNKHCDPMCDHAVLQCNMPNRYDGQRMARMINAIPDLLNEIADLKKQINNKQPIHGYSLLHYA